MTRLLMLLASGVLTLSGCRYDEAKALRSYNKALAPVREQIDDFLLYEPRILEGGSPEKIRDFVKDEVLVRVSQVVTALEAIDPKDPSVSALHAKLTRLWIEYRAALSEFAEDLRDANFARKKTIALVTLQRIDVEWRSWLTEMADRHREIAGE